MPPQATAEQDALVRVVLDSAYNFNNTLGDSYAPGEMLYATTRIEIQAGNVLELDLSNLDLPNVESANLLALPQLQRVDIRGNALDFADLLPLQNAPFELLYGQQALIGEPQQVIRSLNTQVTLNATRTTESDQLQWLYQGDKLTGETALTFELENAAYADAGVYTYQLANPLFPQLTLTHQPITLQVVPALAEPDSAVLNVLRTVLPPTFTEQWTAGQLAGEWPGITVENDRIVELNLNNAGLTGELPSEIGELTQLRRLTLFGNELTSLPESIGQLSELEYLDLDQNQLTELPESLGNLVKLRTLWLARNQLTELPTSLGNLVNLEFLFVQENQLIGLPASVGNLPLLRLLDISRNRLTTLPELSLPALETLKASDNQVSALPQSLLNLTTLQTLELADNDLATLPEQLAAMPELERLALRRNLLDFQDLEPLVGPIADLTINPQRRQAGDEELLGAAGSNITLTANIGGSQNRYQWFKDGFEVAGATEATYTFQLNPTTLGVYTARATSLLVPDVEISSRQITVLQECTTARAVEVATVSQLSYCEGDQIAATLTSAIDGDVEGASYQWFEGGTPIALANSSSYFATAAGTYTLAVTGAEGCRSFSQALVIERKAAAQVIIH